MTSIARAASPALPGPSAPRTTTPRVTVAPRWVTAVCWHGSWKQGGDDERLRLVLPSVYEWRAFGAETPLRGRAWHLFPADTPLGRVDTHIPIWTLPVARTTVRYRAPTIMIHVPGGRDPEAVLRDALREMSQRGMLLGWARGPDRDAIADLRRHPQPLDGDDVADALLAQGRAPVTWEARVVGETRVLASAVGRAQLADGRRAAELALSRLARVAPDHGERIGDARRRLRVADLRGALRSAPHGVTTAALQEIVQTRRQDVLEDLASLVEGGEAVRVGRGHATRYVASSHAPAPLEERLMEILHDLGGRASGNAVCARAGRRRAVVRAAIRRLEAEGALRRGGGEWVAETAPDRDPGRVPSVPRATPKRQNPVVECPSREQMGPAAGAVAPVAEKTSIEPPARLSRWEMNPAGRAPASMPRGQRGAPPTARGDGCNIPCAAPHPRGPGYGPLTASVTSAGSNVLSMENYRVKPISYNDGVGKVGSLPLHHSRLESANCAQGRNASPATRSQATAALALRPAYQFDADEIGALDEGDPAFAVRGLHQEFGALGLEVGNRRLHVVHAEAEVIQAQATVRA